jgi:hypothetical protein
MVADLAGVSHDTVSKVDTILTHGTPSLVQAVRAKDLSIHTAAMIATVPEDEQQDIVARGKQATLEAAKRIRAEHTHRTHYSGEDEWYTPAKYIDMARDAMGTIDLDAASSALAQETVRATHYFSLDNDALTQPWQGSGSTRPIRTHIAHFIAKLVEELAVIVHRPFSSRTTRQIPRGYTAARRATALCLPKDALIYLRLATERPTQGHTFLPGDNPRRFTACSVAWARLDLQEGRRTRPSRIHYHPGAPATAVL